MTPDEVVDEVKASGLRGRGGAGFPAGMKWSFVPKVPGPKYLACNADESEPGTFKDREIMEIEPHLLIEGVAIGSYAIGGDEAFIYIRGEYVSRGDRLRRGHRRGERGRPARRGRARAGDYDLKIHVFRGAGAYICGEETALLESLEGRRPMPRSRPPFPAVEGLYRRPTVRQQRRDARQRAAHPRATARTGTTRSACRPEHRPEDLLPLGRVNDPGNYELPLGSVTFRELIEDYGRRRDRRASDQGRAARGRLGADRCRPTSSTPSWTTTRCPAAGSMLGSASLIVLDETVHRPRRRAAWWSSSATSRAASARLAAKAPPGCTRSWCGIEHGRGSEADLDLLLSLSGEISGKVLCALGDFATSPVTATIQHFRERVRTALGYRPGVHTSAWNQSDAMPGTHARRRLSWSR